MPSFFSNKRLMILMATVITMVVVVGLSMKERPEPSLPEQFVRDSIGFVQSIFYKPARATAGFLDNLREMRTLYRENQKLKANLQEHAVLAAKIKELEEENKQLRKLLDMDEGLNSYQLRAAEVIMRSPDRWYQQVTVNRGTKHGIRPNMAVMTSEGLVGRVKSVAQFTSVIELLTDTNRASNVSAIVQGNEEIFGIIEGYDVEREALLLQNVPIDAELEVGQTVITSGYGGRYPRGLFIGEVIEVIADQYGLTKTGLIQPAANFYKVDFVYIVERTLFSLEDILEDEAEQRRLEEEEAAETDEDEQGGTDE